MQDYTEKQLPAFSIAIVNYKTLDLTQICLELLKRHIDAGLNAQVWVVDNDSQDESTHYLRSLDWIHLIERRVTEKEPGFMAHGKGLDLILAEIKTDAVFLMHTDTFIYDATVFSMMLNAMQAGDKVAAIGCLHQLNRGYVRIAWRTVNGFFKYHFRRLKQSLSLPSRPPKPYIEPYIKSFFALWDVRLMKELGLQFLMEDRIPSYAMQDILKSKGYQIKALSPMRLFQFLDHVEAGTVGLAAGYAEGHRRLARKKTMLEKLMKQLTGEKQVGNSIAD